MKTTGSNYRLKYYDFWFLGKKYNGCNLSLGQFSWGATFLEAICLRGNYLDDKSSKKQFSLGPISRGILSGGNCLWSNCPGAIIWGQLFSGQLFTGQYSSGIIILGENCPGDNDLGGINPGNNHPAGNCPRGNFSWVQMSRHL